MPLILYLRNLCLNHGHRLFLCFHLQILDLGFTNKSRKYFQLVFVCGLEYESKFTFCIWISNYCWKRALLSPVPSLGKTLLAFTLLHSVLQGQIYLLLQVSLDFLLLHPSPL